MSGFSEVHSESLRAVLALEVPAELWAGHPAGAVAADSLAQDGLAAYLYLQWYAAPRAVVSIDRDWPPLEGMLRVAQAEALGWSAATVVRSGGGGVVVARSADGLAKALLRGGYTRPEGSPRLGLAAEAGEPLVAVARSGGIIAEGWWRSWGGGWDPRTAPPGTARLYLAPIPWELPRLMGELTVLLEARGEPWMIKAATRAESLGRPDAVVVYLGSMAAFDTLVPCARDRVRHEPGPALTQQLAPGISWAEDPGDGRSFGESRCLLVAEALKRGVALKKGGAGIAAFPENVAEAFVAAGLDPAQPHLAGQP